MAPIVFQASECLQQCDSKAVDVAFERRHTIYINILWSHVPTVQTVHIYEWLKIYSDVTIRKEGHGENGGSEFFKKKNSALLSERERER